MRHKASGLPPLAEFVNLNDLLRQVQPHFPTVDSVRWFYRNHRERLANAGAVIVIAGRLHFHPQRFQKSVAEIGRAAVAK